MFILLKWSIAVGVNYSSVFGPTFLFIHHVESLPRDPPNQAAKSPDTRNKFAKLGGGQLAHRRHRASGAGTYSCARSAQRGHTCGAGAKLGPFSFPYLATAVLTCVRWSLQPPTTTTAEAPNQRRTPECLDGYWKEQRNLLAGWLNGACRCRRCGGHRASRNSHSALARGRRWSP